MKRPIYWEAVQLEMKSKLRRGKSHPVWAGSGYVIWDCHILLMAEVQGRYCRTSDVDQMNPGHSLRRENHRTGAQPVGSGLTASEAGSWNP